MKPSVSVSRRKNMSYSALLTDLYQLTMLAGYFEKGMHEETAVFDLFFRTPPFRGGYVVFAGLEPALRYLSELHFRKNELSYLKTLGLFNDSFLTYLEGLRFRGSVVAIQEGTAVFPLEPLLTVEAPLAQAQLVETALLNIINFQSLVATKAARITSVAKGKDVIEFGLRRAHGPDGGLSEARGAFIGGARSTSNVQAGQIFGIPVKGTHAHSWIMAFPDELSSFRAYADVFPDSSILLVDTYDTLKSGIPNAIIVARELREKGHELRAVRLDSGDLAYLSRETRRMLDEAGFPGVKILASNELDENVIRSLHEQGGQIDMYGVGTRLATCQGEGGGALGGVYKLVRYNGQPKLKVTSDFSKSTIPDLKSLFRVVAADGTFLMDVICRDGESPAAGDLLHDPRDPGQTVKIPPFAILEPLRSIVMEDGKMVGPTPTLDDMADRCQAQFGRLPEEVRRLEDVVPYGVYLSQGLHDLRMCLIEEVQKGYR